MSVKPYLLVLPLALLLAGCGNNANENTIEEQEDHVSLFLNQFQKFGQKTEGNPIETFTAHAERDADKRMELTKGNIEDALKTAQKFNYAVVVTENHTIIRLVDFEDCQQSGSWGACMPKGKGYIKRGEMESQNDYINNLMGKPDKQKRVLYLFKWEDID